MTSTYSNNGTCRYFCTCSNTSHGKTPLHLAAQNGHYSLLDFLLHHQQTPETAIEIIDYKFVRLYFLNNIIIVMCSILLEYCSLPRLQRRSCKMCRHAPKGRR